MKSIAIAGTLLFGLMQSTSAQKKESVFLSKDSTQNYYITLLPDSASKGMLVILGGFCTTPDEIMKETDLPMAAQKAGYTVVLPYFLDDCSNIDTQNIYVSKLKEFIPHWIKQYQIPGEQYVIGGHSLGGLRALYFTEWLVKNNASEPRPKMVFGVDPPLDLSRLYKSFEYNVRINFSEVAAGEGREMMRRFKIMYKGTPATNPSSYTRYSAYSANSPNGGNIQYLKNIPVRLYSDPDINWGIENRRSRLELTNTTDLVGSLSQLRLLGNRQAEFVNCLGKGVKPNGERHPHFFSMLDANEFVQWMSSNLQKTK